MANVTPSGMISLAMDRLRRMLAASETWQTWCGAEDATEALDFISLVDREPDRAVFAIVDLPDEFEHEAQGGGAQNLMWDSGMLVLVIQAEVPEAYQGLEPGDELNAALDFANKLGAVIAELAALAGTGTGDYLNVQAIRLSAPGIQRTARQWRESRGDFHIAGLGIRY